MKTLLPYSFVSILLTFVFLTSSCGSQKPMVKDIDVHPSYTADGELWISVESELSMGNVSLPNLSLPLIPKVGGDSIGTLSMISGSKGKNTLYVDLNLSKLSKHQFSQGALPNGGILPLIGYNQTLEIKVKNEITLYLSFNENAKAAFGVAIPFKTFDSIGNKLGTTSLFPAFRIKNVIGAAGIYTSKTKGKNGFGLFADLSGTLSYEELLSLSNPQQFVMEAVSIIPKKKVEDKINDELYKLHKKKRTLAF